MEVELIALLIAIGVFIGVFFVKGIIDEKSKEKAYINKLRFGFGKYPEREYTDEQYVGISGYYRNNKTDNYIDDITWNDLDMDAVFMGINNTQSSAGEEYLYFRLRNPKLAADSVKRDEELIDYFYNHKEDSVKIQTAFHKMGRTGKYSLYDYLNYLDNIGSTSNFKHIIGLLLYVAGIALIFVNPFVGIVSLISIMCYNMISYSKIKSDIEPYFISIKYILRLLTGIERVEGCKIDIIKDNVASMNEKKKLFKKIRRKALFLSLDNSDFNLFAMIYIYIKMLFHVDLMIFNSVINIIKSHTDDINAIVTELGYIESSVAIASYRKYVNDFCIPEFNNDMNIMADEMYHPLIENPVKNSFSSANGVLLTGSNASGKSTFLKTVAINAILAQTINTCLAKRYVTNYYRVYSSMALRDNLDGGESYYIVEIKALKRILDSVHKDMTPVLCFVDEVLRGTNTVERIAASTQILISLANSNTKCFAATHDIELTHLLEDYYDNYHFEEEVVNDDVMFNYKLLKGRATTRNAIKLLSIIGYDNKIIDKANTMAGNFISKGVWE